MSPENSIPDLIGQLPDSSSLTRTKLPSTLFDYFSDGRRLVVAAGESVTTKQAGWALVYGLSEIANRPEQELHLVLPAAHAFSTTQRVPWLKAEARPTVWVHENGRASRVEELSREATVANVHHWAESQSKAAKAPGPAAELARAATPAHLGKDGSRVDELVEWATTHPQLDASHLRGSRVWHCAGQRVLSIERHGGSLEIRAGIHHADRAAHPDVTLDSTAALSPEAFSNLRDGVEAGIGERLYGDYLKPDEHWLQSVIRRNPALVGVESPALREVPAWRPAGATGTFGRGFLDLLGLDGHGDIRLVEAKLAKSTDDMTLMQGLDYHVWALAYREAIGQKLSARNKAGLRLHYAIGVTEGGTRLLPPRVYRYAYALDTDAVPFRVHVLRGWDTLKPEPRSELDALPWAGSALPSFSEYTGALS